MRKVPAALFISLDGVVESPEKWQFEFDEGMEEAMAQQLAVQDAVLLGRVTYQEWAPYWPTSPHEPFASFINNTPKYVFSSTLEHVDDWQHSTLVKGSLADTIHALKQQPGKLIGTAGSPTLVRSLLRENLLDELVLSVHPAVAGKGKRLFADDGDLQRLQLVEAKPTRSGVVILTYRLPEPVED